MSFEYSYEKIIADEVDNISSMAFLNDSTLIVATCKGRLRKVDVETSGITAEVACPGYIANIDIFEGVIVTSGTPCCAWDARTLEKIVKYCEQAVSVKIIHDTRNVVTGEHRSVVRMWDLDTGVFIKTLAEGEDTADVVRCIEYDPAHDEVWYGTGCEIRCVNVFLGEKMRTFTQHTGEVYVVRKVGDDEFLSGCGGGMLCKWKSDATSIVQNDAKHSLRRACFLKKDVLLSTYDYDLLLCDTATLECKKVASNAYFLGPFVCSSPSGLRFAYGKSQFEIVVCRK